MTRFGYSLAAATVVAGTLLVVPVGATNEAHLKDWFEGRRVRLRIDMPGTHEGVNVYPESRRDLDTADYRQNLRRYGVAIPAGDSAMVTLVKVKKDLIEFQLDGGGYGTFFDDTATSVHIPYVQKSNRERELEREIRNERNRDRRYRMQRELDGLRAWRERENHRIAIERERMSERKHRRVAFNRVNGGARFNLRFHNRVPYGLQPEDIVRALSEYVDFGSGRYR